MKCSNGFLKAALHLSQNKYLFLKNEYWTETYIITILLIVPICFCYGFKEVMVFDTVKSLTVVNKSTNVSSTLFLIFSFNQEL